MADPTVVSPQALETATDLLYVRASYVLFACMIGAVAQAVLYGLSGSAVTLGLGAVISWLALIMLGMVVRRDEKKLGPGRNRGLETACTIIIGAFAGYLVLYRGLWGARPLLHDVTAPGIAVHAIFVGCGAVLWTVLGKLSIISMDLDKGKIALRSSDQGTAG